MTTVIATRWLVESDSEPDTPRIVEVSDRHGHRILVCDCPAGTFRPGHPCRHITAVAATLTKAGDH